MNKKCILPWIHLQADSDGTTRACCNTDKSTDTLGNILTESPITVWNNENYIKLRTDMMNGIENPACKPCYNSERLGLYSKRQRENDDWKRYNHLMENPIAPFEIRHLDIRFDNVCNFKCRYCSPWLSHSWANDYKKLGWDIQTVSAINVHGPNLFDVIKDTCIDTLESVFFCGGEPLLMDQHLELLQLLDRKQMYDTKLLYISNLSKLKYKGVDYIELWSKFSDVNLHFSLDCIGPKLEYIRCGAKWSEIEKNIRTVFEHKDRLKPKIAITVTMYNASEILDTVKFLTDTGYISLEDIALHVVRKPEIYSCQILPKHVKETITKDVTKFLSDNDLPLFFKSRYEYFINYMNDNNTFERDKAEFREMTDKLDAIRGETFNETFPELKGYYD
jgi:organic radical activating enzyme